MKYQEDSLRAKPGEMVYLAVKEHRTVRKKSGNVRDVIVTEYHPIRSSVNLPEGIPPVPSACGVYALVGNMFNGVDWVYLTALVDRWKESKAGKA